MEKKYGLGETFMNAREKFGPSGWAKSSSGASFPLPKASKWNEIQIKLHGCSRSATGKHGDSEKQFRLIRETVEEVTGGSVKKLDQNEMILTIAHESLKTLDCVKTKCRNGELLEEINTRLKSCKYRDAKPVTFIEILSNGSKKTKTNIQGAREKWFVGESAKHKLESGTNTEITQEKAQNLNSVRKKLACRTGVILRHAEKLQSKLTKSNVSIPEIGKHEYQAVQIVLPDVDTNGGYCIKRQEIERIFGQPSVANTPVAIYSMAGAFRKGKSFMLNFFLRYLSAVNKNATVDWLTSKEDKLNKGFIWRGGAERHTQGIWIWDEPFFIQTPKGKVALFLMDTQGAFDHQSSVKDCSVIFGLSILLSSVQIYNVQGQIQEDTLQYLQLFTEYAKHVKHSDEEPLFQELMFLVRDWSDSSASFGFEGGNKVLKNVLQPKSEHQDTESVRNDIEKSFQQITCCLIPHPGLSVTERSESDGNDLKISDVRDLFLQTVDIMVRELFSPDKIVAKRINKKPVTGIDLINYTLSCFEVFSSGTMPEVQTIMQATAKAAILKIIQECKETYRDQMNSKLENEYRSCAEIHEFHKESKTQALQEFDKQRKLGDEGFIAKYRKNLVENIEQKLAEFEQLNKTVRETVKDEARDEMDNSRNNYIHWIKKYIGDEYVDELSLINEDQKCRKEAVNSLQTKTSNLPLDVVLTYKNHLKKQLSLEFEKFEESNKHTLERHKQQLETNSKNASNSYKRMIEEKTNQCILSDDEFTDVHNLAENKALNEFDVAFTDNNDEYKDLERRDLLKRIQQIKENYAKSSQTRRELAQKKIIAETLEDVKQEYVSAMTNTNYVEEGELEQLHLESKTNAETYLVSKDNLYEKCKEQFNAMIENEYKDIKRVNEEAKIILDQEGKAAVGTASIAFEDCLRNSTSGNYVDQRTLLEVEKKSWSEALKIFEEKTINLPKKNKNDYLQQLKEILSRQEQQLKQNSIEKLEKMKNSLEKLSDLSFKNYMQSMKSKCAEQIMSDEDFNEAHKKANTEALETFESSDVGLNTTERSETKEKLLLRINERQSKLKVAGERNWEQVQTKTIETLNAAAIVYSSKMEETCIQGYVKELLLEEASARGKQKAKEVIHLVSDKSIVDKCMELLDAIIDNDFEEIKMKNKERMELEFSKLITKTMEFHTAVVNEGSGGKYVEERLMPGLEQSCRVQALQFLKKETKQYPGEVVANYQRELEIQLYQEWKEFQEGNCHKFVKLKVELDKEVESACNKYQEIMQETCANEIMTEEAFEKVHQKNHKGAIEEFLSSKVGESFELKNDEQKRLIAMMQQVQSSYRKANETKRRAAEIESLEKLEKAGNTYKLEIAKTCNDKYVDGEKLEQAHNESKEKAKTIVTSFDKKHLIKDFMSKFEELIDNEYQKIQNKNKDLKDKAIYQFRQKKLDAYESYQCTIDFMTQQYMEADEMKKVHQQEMDKALDEYDKGGLSEPQNDFKLLRTRLEGDIQRHYQLVSKKNNDLKWMLEEKGEKVLQSIKMAYIKLMDEVCNETYVEPALLHETHQQFMNEVGERFTDELGENAFDIVEKLIEKCHNELDENYKAVENLNASGKDIQQRKRRERFEFIAGGVGKFAGGFLGIPFGPSGVKGGIEVGNSIGQTIGYFLAKVTESKK